MQSSTKKFSMLGVLILLGVVTLSGCATRKYVRQEVGAASSKLEVSIKDTNTRVTETGEKVDAVDRRAQLGIQAAQAADQKATQAGAAAQAADQKAARAQTTADAANTAITQVNTRISGVENRFNTIDTYTASGSPTSITFKNASFKLSEDAKASLDSIVSQVSGKNSGFAIEIQGFTDSRGAENYNDSLSERRAESVKRYLVSKNVPLMRIAIVGLGEANPVADNKTRAGREQNRRVEVRVLTAAQGRTTSNNND